MRHQAATGDRAAVHQVRRDVVFAGHEHFYERLKPQKGVNYFISGGGAKLRQGDIDRRSSLHASGFDDGYHFILVEMIGDEMHFQVITDQGLTVDKGLVRRGSEATPLH